MSGTDTPDGETDRTAGTALATDDGRPADARGCSAEEGDATLAWKVCCRVCGELVPAKPYCYDCGAEQPADGNYYVEERVTR